MQAKASARTQIVGHKNVREGSRKMGSGGERAIACVWPAMDYTLPCVANGKVLENGPKKQ